MDAIYTAITIFSGISLITSIYTLSKYINILIQLEAFKKSTHTIQYVGASKGDVKLSETLEEYNKEYSEESQLAYPEFATFEGDLDVKGL